jgi:hypothetical protein
LATQVTKTLQKRISYPWDEWTNGHTWEIVHGTDFTCDVASMRSLLYGRARKANMTVVTSSTEDDDTITFCFTKN